MKPTIEKTVTLRPFEEAETHSVVKNEVVPVLERCRAALNQEFTYAAGGTTEPDAAYVTLWESEDAPEMGTWMLEARMVGADEAGGSCVHYFMQHYRLDAGVPIAVGAVSAWRTTETNAAMDCRFTIDGNRVILEGRGDGTNAITFSGRVTVAELIVA